MKKELWLIWKNKAIHKDYMIGKLIFKNNIYYFSYNDDLKDAIKNGFTYYPGFMELDKTYENDTLFANILTRLPNKSRPDYLDILNFYNLDKNSSIFEILTATKGRCNTDNFEFVESFDTNKVDFDIDTYNSDIQKCKDLLKVNSKLYLINDNNDIKVVFNDKNKDYFIGYAPNYYFKYLSNILNQNIKYSAMVQKINLEPELYGESIKLNVKLILN